MSGAMRSAIGPAKASLLRYLAEAQTHLDARPVQNASVEDWAKWVQILKNDRRRINDVLTRLDVQIQRWTEVIIRLPAAEKEAENVLFGEIANGENGLTQKMEQGHEKVTLLSSNIEIGEKAEQQNGNGNGNGNVPNRQNVPNANNPHRVQVHLPRINLPQFEGDASLWPSFWDSFFSSIHQNNDLSDIDRFNYLNRCLKGEARKLIQGYFVTSANYTLAIEKLRERYGDENQIKSDLRNELQRLPPASKFMNSIKETVDNMERILLQLQQLDEDTNQTFVLSAIENKMPRWILVELEKNKMDLREKWDIEEEGEAFNWDASKARECLKKIVKLYESVNKIANNPTSPKNTRKPFNKPFKRDEGDNTRVFHSNTKEMKNTENDQFFGVSTQKPKFKREFKQSDTSTQQPAYNKAKNKNLRKYPCIFCGNESHSSTGCQKYSTGVSRQKRLAILKKCISCFKDAGHTTCPNERRCDKCNGPHKSIVCTQFAAETQNVQNCTSVAPADQENAQINNLRTDGGGTDILLMTQSTNARFGKNEKRVKIFMDPGASRSFITVRLAERMGIDLSKQAPITINAHGMFGHKTTFVSQQVKIQLEMVADENSLTKKASYRQFVFRTTHKITNEIAMPTISNEEFKTIKQTKNFPSVRMDEVDILIGMDYFWDIVKTKTKLNSGFYLIETIFGPVLCGGKAKQSPGTKTNCANFLTQIETETIFSYGLWEEIDDATHIYHGLKNDLEKSYSLEGIGITDPPGENDDEAAQTHFEKAIEKKGERYQVRWPFKPNPPPLPTNKNLCLRRLNSTISKLKNTIDPPNLLQMYDKIFNDQMSDGIIEEVMEETISGGMVHYLPHQAVYRADKKKLRVVMDASAHLKGCPSLNDILYRGPVLLPKVASVLLRWRNEKTIVICDIKSAFLMLELHPADRDVTRFIWLKNLNEPPTPKNLKIYRFCRVLFGAISSPFLLCATIQYHLRNSEKAKMHPELAEEIAKSIYMDNILLLSENEKIAAHKIKLVREIFSEAGMDLREFLSNNESALNDVEPENKIVPNSKFLGLDWEIKSDQIHFSLSKTKTECDWTMRKILRVINGVFDPLGLINPITLHARIFFQSLWAKNLKWDTTLPNEDQNTWITVLAEWKEGKISTNRLINTKNCAETQIHVFTDASTAAYGTTVYIRTSENDVHSTNLLFARSRLAPKSMKDKGNLTIPKLELLGIVIGTRAGKFVKEELGLDNARTIVWSDSEIALHWIGSDQKLPVFIENRCREIRQNNMEFRHVRTEFNPADLTTRGQSPKNLQTNEMGWKGPNWLKEDESNWPKNIEMRLVKEEKESDEQTLAIIQNIEQKSEILDPKKFSNLNRMIFTLMFILRFVRSLAALVPSYKPSKKLAKFSFTSHFSGTDYQIAEMLIIKQCQKSSPLTKNEKFQRNFALFEDSDGIIRSKSRLQKSHLLTDSIQPIFLPMDNRVTSLIILDTHKKYFHAGISLTHSVIVRKFCGITKRTIQKSIGQCLECKKRKALPYNLPPFPPYPSERVNRSNVFSHIGLDYLGPTVVRDKTANIQKIWVMLITCMATRAVWLDGISDLSAKTFLNALRRFIAKRGCPRYILSDNASNFTLGHKTVDLIWSKSIQNAETMDFLAKEKIQWKFIVPMASWEGGAYERLCGLAKSSFKKAIGRNILGQDDMATLIAEVEATMNSRPLMPIDDNPESIIALRPFDFITDGAVPTIPQLESEDEEWKIDNPPEKLLQIYRQSLRIKNKFWKNWQNQYLNFLKERRQRMHKFKGREYEPKIGEIVIVSDDRTYKNTWKLGKIVQLPSGEPGQIRSAFVLMPNGKTLQRTLAHLTPLEISPLPSDRDVENATKNTMKDEQKPQRKAKTDAKAKIAEIAKTENNMALISNAFSPKKFPFLFLPILLCATFCKGDLLPYQCTEAEQISLVYAEPYCNTKATLIYAKNHAAFSELCYTIVTCEYGRFTQTNNAKGWECSSRCLDCKNWATDCSPYTMDDLWTTPPTLDLSVIDSPKLTAQNDETIQTLVHQIELFDGSRHSVQQLQLKTIELFNENPICEGDENGQIIGTPQFCAKNECGTSGTKFCFYPHREVTFYVGNGGEIPIKAWGNVRKTNLVQKNRKLLNCEKCRIECIQHGLDIHFDNSTFQTLEICCQPYCYHQKSYTSPAKIMLSKDILLSEHKCVLTLWTGEHIKWRKLIEKTCPSQSICSLIECYLCTDIIANPECWPNYSAFLLGMGLALLFYFIGKCCIFLFMLTTFASQISCCVRSAIRITLFIGKLPFKIVRFMWRHQRKITQKGPTKRDNNLNEFQPFIPRPWPRRAITTTTFLIAIIILKNRETLAATQFSSFIANKEDCVMRENNSFQCTISQQTIMTLTPSNHISQLLIKSPDNLLIGTLSIIIEEITVECQKISEFFTRSHEVLVHSSKRCPKQGSCSGQTCAKTNLTAKIPELSAVNDLPGNAFCVDSCSFLLCGCGLLTTSCIFYRTYAKILSKNVYEFLSCPAWHYTISLTMKITDANGKKTLHKIQTPTGIQNSLPNGLKITISSITQPPIPVLANRFLFDGKKVMIAGDISSDLFCESKGEAETFSECKLRPNTCQCSVVDPTVNCQCQDGNLERHFLERPDKVLPIQSETFLLKNDGSRIFSSLTQASMQMQIALNKFKLVSSYDPAICTVTAVSITGCYSCLAGAKLRLKCHPSTGNALAQIICEKHTQIGGKTQFSVFCDGQNIETTLALNHAQTDMRCRVICPAGETSFKIEGHLNYVAQKSWVPMSTAIGDLSEGNGIDWSFIFGFMLNFPRLIYLILTAFGIFIAILLFIKLNPIFRIWKLLIRAFFVIILIEITQTMEYGPKAPDNQIAPADWEQQMAEYGDSFLKQGSVPTPDELFSWWQKKSALGVVPAAAQSNPRKYERGGTELFDTKKQHDEAVKAALSVPGKRQLERLQHSARISQNEAVPIPPEGLKLAPPPKAPPLPPPPPPPPPALNDWDCDGLNDQQMREIEQIRKMVDTLTQQGQQLIQKYKQHNDDPRVLAAAMIETNHEKLDGLGPMPDQRPWKPRRYGPPPYPSSSVDYRRGRRQYNDQGGSNY